MKKIKKITLNIKGMHCPSCNILIRDKFLTEKNITKVIPDFRKQQVEVYYQNSLKLDKLNKLIQPFGYQITEKINLNYGSKKDLLDFIFFLGFFLIVFLILKEINFIPSFNYHNLSLLGVFFLGLVASTSTCMATTGVLYLAINQTNNRLSTAISFSLGRLLAYGFFGFLFGLLGKSLINSIFFNAVITFFIGLMMVFLGLELAKIFSWQKFFPQRASFLFNLLREKLNSYPRRLPFFLGAITYFLPCGFTQSIQVYSLGFADPIRSSLNMFVFALGTIPLILFINQATRIRQINFYQQFLKAVGVLVFIIGLSYFMNLLSLFNLNLFDRLFFSNSNPDSVVKVNNNLQEIRMVVNSAGYSPNFFRIKKDIPVKWVVVGENVLGCQGFFVVPKLGISQALKEGVNIFEFIPKETGLISFSCGMGMYRGAIEIIN